MCAALALDLEFFFRHDFIGLVYEFSQVVTEANTTNETDKTTSCHQSRKPLLDFLRIVLMDSLLNVSASSNTHPVVLLLQVNSY